jgi:hypothetical protein
MGWDNMGGCGFMGGIKNGSKFLKGKVGGRVNAK